MLFCRLISIACLCVLVASCGFQPLYVPVQETNRVAVPLKIATIQERDGQILRNYLVDLLTPEGTPQKPLFILEVSLTDAIQNIGVNKDETTNRKNAIMTATFTLRNAQNYRTVYTHTAKAINSFSVISENYFSDITTEEYAKKEALRLLAEKISLLVITFLDSQCEEACIPVCQPEPVQESWVDEN